jgi:hypothetical protein
LDSAITVVWTSESAHRAATTKEQAMSDEAIDELKEHLRHKEVELAYLKKQKAMVKFEVKALRRLVENAEQE